MKFTLLALMVLLLTGSMAPVQDCDEFQAIIRDTYNFVPSELSREQKNAAGQAMDGFWKHVKADPQTLLPCLRAALSRPVVNSWFGFDGSTLLVSLDPSRESKLLQVRHWSQVPFADVSLQYWVETLAGRGQEGFDVSAAGERWLASSEVGYRVVRHGLFPVGPFEGGLFLFGSMDEAQATPVLARIAADAEHPGRMIALQLLSMQATPEAWRALASMDVETLPARDRTAFRQMRQVAPVMPEGHDALTFSRAELLEDLRHELGDEQAQSLKGNPDPADWIRNAVRVLRPEDLDLIRRARRLRVTVSSDEAVHEYRRYSLVLQVRTWTPVVPEQEQPR